MYACILNNSDAHIGATRQITEGRGRREGGRREEVGGREGEREEVGGRVGEGITHRDPISYTELAILISMIL